MIAEFHHNGCTFYSTYNNIKMISEGSCNT